MKPSNGTMATLSRIDALLAAGVTITAIAEAAGVERPHLSRWLAARRREAARRVPIEQRLAEALPGLERAAGRPRKSTRRA